MVEGLGFIGFIGFRLEGLDLRGPFMYLYVGTLRGSFRPNRVPKLI